jgi:hypothetical protein
VGMTTGAPAESTGAGPASWTVMLRGFRGLALPSTRWPTAGEAHGTPGIVQGGVEVAGVLMQVSGVGVDIETHSGHRHAVALTNLGHLSDHLANCCGDTDECTATATDVNV